jgi:ABC-2 type transport system permease protein
MRTLVILFRKELHETFTSPIAYTMATVFLLVLGYTFSLTLFATKVANLNYISLMILMFVGSLAYAVVLRLYGDPDWGPIYSGYLAVLLNTSLLVSVGLLMSSLTENQVVAAALSLGTFLMLWFADSVAYLLPQPFELFAVNLSLIGHFKPLASGEVFLSDVGYFITVSLLALFLTTRHLMER